MAINIKQPPLLSKYLSTPNIPIRLRSTSSTTLKSGPFLKSYGTCAVSSYTPSVWNSLPIDVCHATYVTS